MVFIAPWMVALVSAAPVSGAQPMKELYLTHVKPYLSMENGHPSDLDDPARATSVFTTRKLLLPANLHEPLADLERVTPAQAVRHHATTNPLIHGRVVSEEGTASLILINVVRGSNQAQVFEDTYRILEPYRDTFTVRIIGDLILS